MIWDARPGSASALTRLAPFATLERAPIGESVGPTRLVDHLASELARSIRIANRLRQLATDPTLPHGAKARYASALHVGLRAVIVRQMALTRLRAQAQAGRCDGQQHGAPGRGEPHPVEV